MYLLKNDCTKQINMSIELSNKPSIDLPIHWLNPLLHKCDRKLYPSWI